MCVRTHRKAQLRGIIVVLAPAVAATVSVIFQAPATSVASTVVHSPASLSLTLGLTAPPRWWFGQAFDSYLLVKAPGIPSPTELGSSDGRTVVSVTPAPQAACRRLPPRFAGMAGPGYWCLRLASIEVGTTVEGRIASPEAQLDLKVSARDPIVPLPLLVTLLGLAIGLFILLVSPERLTPTLRRWSLYAKVDENTRAAEAGRPAIVGISRDDLRSWKTADGRRLDHDPMFIDMALEAMAAGRSRLMTAREKLGDAVRSATSGLKDTSLLNRASAEANSTSVAWSDFFDEMGKPRAKLPPERELERLSRAADLLGELQGMYWNLGLKDREKFATQFIVLRGEIGRTGEAPDVDRALAAAEEGVKQLRQEVRPYLIEFTGEVCYAYREAEGAAVKSSIVRAILLGLVALSIVALAVALPLTGHVKIIVIAGLVVAGILGLFLVLIVLAGISILVGPSVLSATRWVYRRLLLPIAKSARMRYRSWRYVLLRDLVTAIIVVMLLGFGTISVLATSYENHESFGSPLDYITLGVEAATISVCAAILGYFTARFHRRTPR